MAAGETFLAMIDKGFELDQMQATNAWSMISYFAANKKDAELLARAIEEFKKAAQDGRYRDANLKRMEKALKKLKS